MRDQACAYPAHLAHDSVGCGGLVVDHNFTLVGGIEEPGGQLVGGACARLWVAAFMCLGTGVIVVSSARAGSGDPSSAEALDRRPKGRLEQR